jgi:predicted DNA-binding transcriptional regulator YafY
VNQRTVKIWYQALGDEEATERSIDPYFIEPAAAGHASYLIGYCHRTTETRTFKIERIRAIEITPETYQIPADFDANAYLAPSWGIVAGGEVETVRLRFSRELARIMGETVWHPSQRLEPQRDGSVIVTFRVTDTVELCSWIMGWGEKVEVLEPEELRQHTIATAEAMRNVYRQG